jgi:GTPase
MIMQQKNALIISLDETHAEIIQLADTLGYKIVKTFIQHRDSPDTNSYVGIGKLEEIKEFITTSDEPIEVVIVNGELKPSQWFSLENTLKKDVYDRIRLILAIFEKHAERREAKLQVKLAQLEYERPYVRELIHRAKAGEHPGYMGGGEYPVADYYEMIKKQMKTISEDLEKISNNRLLHRKTRYKSGFYLVSLAGYTNAGKSSLLNLLASEHVHVEDQLFSTLSTTTRRISKNIKGKNIPILLTDTVGFIENLPSMIIDAFHSTLEEIKVADLIVLVLDGSEEKQIVEKKLKVSLNELHELGVNAPIIIALNKIDLANDQTIQSLIHYLKEQTILNNEICVPISVKQKKGIATLLDTINKNIPNNVQLTLHLPINEQTQTFISELYKKTQVTELNYTDIVSISLTCNTKIKDKIIAQSKKLGGTIL